MMKRIVWFAGMLVLIAGCSDQTSGPGGSLGGNVLVKLTATPGASSGAVQLSKTSDGWWGGGAPSTVESLYVQSATIILKDIAFTGGVDTVRTRDSVACERDEEAEEHGEWHKKGLRIHFRGPFLVDLTNGTPTQITLDTIPPGSYNGIRFLVHKLRSKDVMANPAFPDSLVGYSIVVRGFIRYAGGNDSSFVFKTNINEEFKVKGNFVVSPGDNVVPYVLNFDMASWFQDYQGRVLDPNNYMDRFRIRYAVMAALGGKSRMCGGKDRDDNGYPD